jgi:hypothetical protein
MESRKNPNADCNEILPLAFYWVLTLDISKSPNINVLVP